MFTIWTPSTLVRLSPFAEETDYWEVWAIPNDHVPALVFADTEECRLASVGMNGPVYQIR